MALSVEIDKQVDVGVRSGIASGSRPENAHVANTIPGGDPANLGLSGPHLGEDRAAGGRSGAVRRRG